MVVVEEGSRKLKAERLMLNAERRREWAIGNRQLASGKQLAMGN